MAIAVTAHHHHLSTLKTGKVCVLPEFGAGGAARHMCDTRCVHHAVNIAYTYVCCRLDVDFRSSLPQVQARKIDHICSMIHQRIHSTATDLAMAQPHDSLGSFDEDFLDHLREELMEQPDNALHRLSSIVSATEASTQFSGVLPMGGSAIASSSQPVPCSNSNSDSNDITSITNMTSVDNMGLVDGSTIVDGAMSLRG